MNEQEQRQFPASWQREEIAKSFIKLQGGKEYLTVAQRIAWFQSEQRTLIAAGVATQPYRIQIVEQVITDTSAKYTLRVEDVLGNVVESTGSETQKDFKDFDEKAFTKALGRCLASMGYSTVEAMERDEGDDPIADAPQERRASKPPVKTPQNFAQIRRWQIALKQPTNTDAELAAMTDADLVDLGRKLKIAYEELEATPV